MWLNKLLSCSSSNFYSFKFYNVTKKICFFLSILNYKPMNKIINYKLNKKNVKFD